MAFLSHFLFIKKQLKSIDAGLKIAYNLFISGEQWGWVGKYKEN